MSDEGEKLGVAAAVEDVMAEMGDQAFLPVPPVEQLAMLFTNEDGTAKKPTLGEQLDACRERGPGRPKGSRNRSTEDLRKYLLNKYTHPLETLAVMYSRPTAALAAELGCDTLDAAKLQVACAGKVAEYVAQKMPQAHELKGEAAIPIFFQVGGEMAKAVEQGGALGLLRDATTPVIEGEKETVENQELSEDDQ